MDSERRRIIEHECKNLSIAYARYVDFQEYEQFVELFAPDGELNVTGRPVIGHENLTKAMAMRSDSLRSRHVLTNIYTNVIDEDHAEGISYLTLYRHEGGDHRSDDEGPREITGPAAIGHYRDKFIRTDEGWRFASRVLYFAFRVKT
ncbi:MAG: nuclear transport factor 2 family protein [Desulfobacteraceae bacterium]|nr:nuclear transport factor 2 family protein [Desulfobacteraceae bacterium]